MKRIFKFIFLSAFLIALSQAIPAYIRSSFLEQFINVDYIGWIFIIASFLTLLVINLLPKFIRKYGNYKVALFLFILNIICLGGLVFSKSSFYVFTFFIILEIIINLVWINMDMFLEKFTNNLSTGRTRAFYFTIMNLGWLASPLLAGYLVGQDNYRAVYVTAFFIMTSVLILIISQKQKLQERVKYKNGNLKLAFKGVFKNRSLFGIFGVALLLKFFYAVSVLFMPIYLHQQVGFSWQTIGYIFTFMLLPFVLLQIPAGIIADKHHNEKNILVLGFMILIASTFLFSRFTGSEAISWAMILFLTRCGAALIEIMNESYFFKLVDVDDVDYIDLFRNIRPVAYLLASLFSVFILKFFDLQYLFFFLAFVMLASFYFIFNMKRVGLK